MNNEAAGWYSRCYQPRFDGEALPQLVTFHLCDALPEDLLALWREEVQEMPDGDGEFRRRLERFLDTGDGDAWLANPDIARLLETAILADDAERYVLHAWVIMPNHGHVLFTPFPSEKLSSIVSTWKKAVAREANQLLDREGDFWFTENYDQEIRGEDHYARTIAYIEKNPVKANLCPAPTDWRFSSARLRSQGL